MAIETDHIHLVMQIKPSDSISGVAQVLKGGTSRVIRKEFAELEEFLWGDSFWADGYFAESVGHVDEDIVKRYSRKCFHLASPDFKWGMSNDGIPVIHLLAYNCRDCDYLAMIKIRCNFIHD